MEELWDDSALIKAYEKAVDSFKVPFLAYSRLFIFYIYALSESGA